MKTLIERDREETVAQGTSLIPSRHATENENLFGPPLIRSANCVRALEMRADKLDSLESK